MKSQDIVKGKNFPCGLALNELPADQADIEPFRQAEMEDREEKEYCIIKGRGVG